jgi:hypothetical protein
LRQSPSPGVLSFFPRLATAQNYPPTHLVGPTLRTAERVSGDRRGSQEYWYSGRTEFYAESIARQERFQWTSPSSPRFNL